MEELRGDVSIKEEEMNVCKGME